MHLALDSQRLCVNPSSGKEKIPVIPGAYHIHGREQLEITTVLHTHTFPVVENTGGVSGLLGVNEDIQV